MRATVAITEASPARIIRSARLTARSEEAQTLLIVSEGTESGRPAFSVAWREVSKDRPLAEVEAEYHRRRDEALAMQKILTDFRLYWDALSAALSNRDKIVIDADKVPGRRSLWLIPPGPFGLPLPSMMPATKPPSEIRGEP